MNETDIAALAADLTMLVSMHGVHNEMGIPPELIARVMLRSLVPVGEVVLALAE
jgi:hypothetical protein